MFQVGTWDKCGEKKQKSAPFSVRLSKQTHSNSWQKCDGEKEGGGEGGEGGCLAKECLKFQGCRTIWTFCFTQTNCRCPGQDLLLLNPLFKAMPNTPPRLVARSLNIVLLSPRDANMLIQNYYFYLECWEMRQECELQQKHLSRLQQSTVLQSVHMQIQLCYSSSDVNCNLVLQQTAITLAVTVSEQRVRRRREAQPPFALTPTGHRCPKPSRELTWRSGARPAVEEWRRLRPLAPCSGSRLRAGSHNTRKKCCTTLRGTKPQFVRKAPAIKRHKRSSSRVYLGHWIKLAKGNKYRTEN